MSTMTSSSALTAAVEVGTPAERAYAEMMIAAAVEDYRELLPLAQRQRLLLICKEAVDSDTEDVERLTRDLLCALCPDVPSGVRDSLAWICGDLAARR